jgi:hypothetical protein
MLSRRSALTLIAGSTALLLFSSTADAAGPATVTVRVEGLTETLVPPTLVTTTTEPVVKDGVPEHSCPGTSALGALQLATGGNWSGPWEEKYKQYEIYSIDGESHPFFSGFYWDVVVNNAQSQTGACEVEMQAGEELLLYPCSEATTECPNPLGVTAPTSANVGEPVAFSVRRYNSTGEGSVIGGASVTGGGASATTDAGGKATLTFSAPGEYMVHATAAEAIRTEMTICVHPTNSSACTPPSPAGSSPSSSATSAGGTSNVTSSPYNGPYAIVAKATNLIEKHVYSRKDAPRVLAGTVQAHTTVASVSLKLRREYRGRCYAYDGTREEFGRARCGTGSYFKVSTGPSFSYLLPSALAPGRYVLDIEATDAAGNRTSLARGTTRTVFYVR